MSDFVIETADGVLRVTINHPERGNGDVRRHGGRADPDHRRRGQDASVMVLRGAGDDFCIGRARGPGGPPADEGRARAP